MTRTIDIKLSGVFHDSEGHGILGTTGDVDIVVTQRRGQVQGRPGQITFLEELNQFFR